MTARGSATRAPRPFEAGDRVAGAVSSSGRQPDLSPAARQAGLRQADAMIARTEHLLDISLQLPSPPRGLGMIERVTWAEDQAQTGYDEWSHVWDALCDRRRDALATPAGRAAVADLEREEKRLARRKDALAAMAKRYVDAFNEEANRISIDGPASKEAALADRALREGRLR
jgi:hypothetical protein